jgi:hypothetical protein
MMHQIIYESDAFIVQGAASQRRSIEILMKRCFLNGRPAKAIRTVKN